MDENEGQSLEMVLKTRIQGAEEIEAGVTASNRFATAENRADRALRATNETISRRIVLQKELNALSDRSDSTQVAASKTPVSKRFQEAMKRADKPDSRNDEGDEHPGGRIKKMIARFTSEEGEPSGGPGGGNPAMNAAKSLLQRFRPGGGGGATGEAEESLGELGESAGGAAESMAGLEAAGGPATMAIGAIITKAVAAAAALLALSASAAAITQKFSDLEARVGSAADAGQARITSRVTGVDAGSASRSLRERITTDPMAMGVAMKYGVSSLPGPYGKRNFGEQYQQLIERLSSNPNKDQSMREADQLGIGQEVKRYALLSTATKDRLKGTAATSTRMNSPEIQRRAAEIEAAMENAGEASDNLKTAVGDLVNGTWMPDLINGLAGVENWLADKLATLSKIAHPGALPSTPNGFSGSSSLGGDTSGSGASSGNSLASQQLEATSTLIQAINDNTRSILGGGPNAQAALPSGMRGPNLSGYAQAVNQGLVHLGSLG